MSVFWARMGGVTVSDEMVLLEAKLGPARKMIEAIARRKVAAALAWDRGITVDEHEVEEALEAYYVRHSVEDVDAQQEWRTRMHLKEDALRSHLRELALIDRLRAEIIAEDDIQRRYRETLIERRLADVDLFEFSSETAAESFMSAVLSGEVEPRLGERHRLPTGLVPQEIADQLATASEGALLGPVATPRTRIWRVYRFLHWNEPPLDAHLREALREELFREMLAPTLLADPLSFRI